MSGELLFAAGGEAVRAAARSGGKVVALGWEARRALRETGLPAAGVKEGLARDADRIVAAAAAAAGRWHRDAAGADLTAWEGVSLAGACATLAWISCLLPAVKQLAVARRAIAEARPSVVACDARAPLFLRRALELLAAQPGAGFALRMEGRAGAAASPLREALGSFQWKPFRPAFFRDVALRLAFNGLSALARPFAGRGRAPILAGAYPTLRPLLAALAGAPGRDFRADLVDWPPRNLALSFLRRGSRVLLPPGAPSRREADAAARMLERWRGARPDLRRDPAFAFDGVSFWPLLERPLEAFLEEHLAPTAAMVSRARRLVRGTGARALLVPFDSMPYQKALVEAARQEGVPSVNVAHGVGFVDRRTVGDGFSASFAVATGPGMRAAYAAQGRAPDEVWEEGGGIIFDPYGPRRPEPPVALRRRILLLTNPDILFLPHGLPGEAEEYVERVLAVLAGFDGLEVTLKIHPVESLAHYRAVVDAAPARPGRVDVVKEGPFARLLAGHGAVIGTNSTAMVEAMVQNRWTIGVNLFGSPFPPPYDGASGMDVARTDEELRARVARLLSPEAPWPDYGRVRRDFAGPLDGRQAERFLERLRGLVARGAEDL